jgi:hypothetical protein
MTEETKEEDTQALETDPTQTQVTAPRKDDGILNILLIGSSAAYYFPDELYGMATHDGMKIRVCNAYSSGLTLEKQWNWVLTKKGDYQFITTDDRGREVKKGWKLDDILKAYDWDVISVHETPMTFRTADLDDARAGAAYAHLIYSYIRKSCPQARYVWYQVFGVPVGYGVEKYTDVAESKKMPTKEKQDRMMEIIRTVAIEQSEKNKADRIPCGDAWKILRNNPAIGESLHDKEGKPIGDYLHDGDVGGGQYLNACIFYEMLIKKSCVGHSWRPDYNLPEDRISLLQQTAHLVVSEAHGENYVQS